MNQCLNGRVKHVVKLLGLVLCPVLGVGFLLVLLDYGRKELLDDLRPMAPFAVGMGLWFWVYWVYFRGRGLGLWDTWEHELTHALFCIITFTKVKGFRAETETIDRPGSVGAAGYVKHEHASTIRSVLIVLSPYFFPTFTMLLLPLRFALVKSMVPWFDLLLGVTFGFYVINRYAEIGLAIRTARTKGAEGHDFQVFGIAFSLLFTLFCHVLIVGFLITLLHGGWSAAWEFLKAGAVYWVT